MTCGFPSRLMIGWLAVDRLGVVKVVGEGTIWLAHEVVVIDASGLPNRGVRQYRCARPTVHCIFVAHCGAS